MCPTVLIWPYVVSVTLIFELLIAKSNQFIFVANCTEVVHLAVFQQAVQKISCHTETAWKQNASGTILKRPAQLQ